MWLTDVVLVCKMLLMKPCWQPSFDVDTELMTNSQSTRNTRHACFKIYNMGWGFFFSVMWQLVFNSLHGNGQNKPRACLLQGRCTTSSGPWNLFICVGENIRRPRCCFFHLFIHFKIEWCWFDKKKNFFKCYNVSPWPRKEHENDNILVFSSNLFLIKQQMWQILISNPQPYSLKTSMLAEFIMEIKKK